VKTIGFALILVLFVGGTVFASEMTVEEWLQYNQQVADMMQQFTEQVQSGEIPPMKCATPIFANLMLTQPKGLNLKPLYPGREDTMSFTYATNHFFLHYTNTGANAVYHYSTQTIEPGIPDYIVMSGRILDSVWNHTVGDLGFHAPLSDGFYNGGGNGLFDVYFINAGFYGATAPDIIVDSIPCYIATAFMFLENDYAESYFHDYNDNPLEAIRVSAAHEFTHACQFALDLQEVDGTEADPSFAWMEMTATAMEEEHYPNVNDYVKNYIIFFYDYPSWSLRTGTNKGSGTDALGRANYARNLHQYGSAVFPIYLGARFSPQIIAEIWNRCGQVPGPNWIQATDASVRAASSDTMTVQDAFQEFATWNLFTSMKRARPGYFRDAILYDTVNLAARLTNFPASVNVADKNRPDSWGANYIILENVSAMDSGLAVTFTPDDTQPWGMTIVEYHDNPLLDISVQQVRYDTLTGPILIDDAADYDKIALIPEVLGGNAVLVDYSLGVTPQREGLYLPNGGETLIAGSSYQIWWYFESADDSAKIELSLDNGASWKDVAVTKNDLTYEWAVPDTPSDECLIRISAYPSGNPSFVSDEPFSIQSATRQVDIYPNPAWVQNTPEMYFRGRYNVAESSNMGEMSVTILTLAGEKVRELKKADNQQAGVVVASWDYTNESGKTVAAGPYLALFKFEGETTLKKFVVMR
jgi:hypothetical protein